MDSYDFSYAIITAADTKYMGFLTDLILSLKNNADPDVRRIPICILDLGLTPADRDSLSQYAARIVTPDWDVEVVGSKSLASYFKGFTVRPFLRKYFPGYDVYLWIDSDTWVQDARVLDYYLKTAWSGKLAATPQIDRCYKSFYKWQRPRYNTIEFKAYWRGFGLRVANKLGRNPFVNCGVFALRADAPHWDAWADALRHAFKRSNWPLVEQAAMNYVIFHERLPTGLLPATCNWVCIDGPPKIDDVTGLYVEPQPPHLPIGILHLLGPAKDMVMTLETVTGAKVQRTLHYGERGLPAPLDKAG